MTGRKPAGVTFESWVERQIREARDRGSFDDLPGTGRPLAVADGDELAWVREKVRREGLPVTALLPPALAVAKEVEDLPAVLSRLRSEQRVRALVEDVERSHRRRPAGAAGRAARADRDARGRGGRTRLAGLAARASCRRRACADDRGEDDRGEQALVAPVRVRAREPRDLEVLLPVLQRRHEQEGYPVRAEAVSDGWLADPTELGAWVALDGERVVGHVALHPAGGAPLPRWERATGRQAARLAVVTRLFTDGSLPGSGRALLSRACEEAAARDLAPVLQVDPESAARGFYAGLGWREVGTARQQWGHRTVDAVLCVRTEQVVRATA